MGETAYDQLSASELNAELSLWSQEENLTSLLERIEGRDEGL